MIEKNDRKKATKEYFDSQAEFYDISHDGRFVKCMYQEIVKRVMTLPGELMLKIINSRLKDSDSGDYRIYGKKQIIPLFQAHSLSVNQWKRINYRTFLFNAAKK